MATQKLNLTRDQLATFLKNHEQIKQFETGGIDQRDMAMATFLQDEFDRFAGNLQAAQRIEDQDRTVKKNQFPFIAGVSPAGARGPRSIQRSRIEPPE